MYLGTQMDYIMTSPLSDFDGYGEGELEAIQEDLQSLSQNNSHLNSIQYATARNRYLQVIKHIEGLVIARLRAQISQARHELDIQNSQDSLVDSDN